VHEVSDDKISKKELECELEILREEVGEIRKIMSGKIEMEEVCNILDNKANIDDINRVF
jgi:hypothetical protein